MPRFFIETILPPDTAEYTIRGEDAHHIRQVLRMQPGETLTVCDGARVDFTGPITGFSGNGVQVRFQERHANRTEPSFRATLYQGLPKGDKFDQIIQKSVELGIGRIVPVACRRSIVKLDTADAARKNVRWNRIAQEAAKQCGRGSIPEVAMPLSFAAAVAEAARAATVGALAFVPYEGERELSLRRLLEQRLPADAPSGLAAAAQPEAMPGMPESAMDARPQVAFFIGPEGGFAPEEIEQALAAGLVPVSLGRRILRTETAAPAVLAMLGYHFNDF